MTKVVDKAIEIFVSSYDMPIKGELLVLVSPNYFDDVALLVGNKNYIQKTCVPFILFENKYYEADTIEIVPNDVSVYVSNARKYVLVEEKDLNKIKKELVYEF